MPLKSPKFKWKISLVVGILLLLGIARWKSLYSLKDAPVLHGPVDESPGPWSMLRLTIPLGRPHRRLQAKSKPKWTPKGVRGGKKSKPVPKLWSTGVPNPATKAKAKAKAKRPTLRAQRKRSPSMDQVETWLARARTKGELAACPSAATRASQRVREEYIDNPNPKLHKDLRRYVQQTKVKKIRRNADTCLVDTNMLNATRRSNTKPENMGPLPESMCYQLEKPPATYVLVLGCGYQGTGATAKFMSSHLYMPSDHEWARSPTLLPLSQNQGVLVKPFSLVSWPATLQSLYWEPYCYHMEVWHQVRHPLKVVNSERSAKASWNFLWKYGGETVDVTNAIPERFRADDAWSYFSTDVKVLLWWLSYNLLAEAQVEARAAEYGDGTAPATSASDATNATATAPPPTATAVRTTTKSSRTFRMEDLFEEHDISPMIDVAKKVSMRPGTDESWTSKIRNTNWAAKAKSLAQQRKYNSHAKGKTKLTKWRHIDLKARGNILNTAADIAALQQEVVALAKLACVHYGYTNCGGREEVDESDDSGGGHIAVGKKKDREYLL